MFESCAAAKLLAEDYQRVPLLCLGLYGRAVEKQFVFMQRTLTDWMDGLAFSCTAAGNSLRSALALDTRDDSQIGPVE